LKTRKNSASEQIRMAGLDFPVTASGGYGITRRNLLESE